jgi:hypothetical protein
VKRTGDFVSDGNSTSRKGEHKEIWAARITLHHGGESATRVEPVAESG